MIKFSLALLDKEPVELEGEEPSSLLGLEENASIVADRPIKYKLLGHKVSGGILVEGRVSTKVGGECGRCLQGVRQKIENNHISLFFENPPGEMLDVTGDVREELLLEFPINLLCSEDCRGLCPGCGANRNTEQCDCEDSAEDMPEDENPWRALDGLSTDKP